MKELDLMVQTFFDDDFLSLSEEEQKIFVRLLDESDLNLFRWLLKGETPATDEFKHIINIMIDAYNSKHSEL
jgi:antitoxin CptB